MTEDCFHLNSMTAYGQGACDFEFGRLVVAIQSVNRRFLEMNINLPRLLSHFEMDIRKRIKASIGRGMINIIVTYHGTANQALKILPNIPLARAIKNAWEKIAEELWLSKELPLILLTQEKELLIYSEEIQETASYQKALFEAVDLALEAFIKMKKCEGELLAQDLLHRKTILQNAIEDIELVAGGATEKLRQKLMAKIQELLSESHDLNERILAEVAIYADKLDITEEITRFKSHLKQFEQILKTRVTHPADSRGKMIEFLLQELGRESNTIGSKASDILVTEHVLKVKNELEKIREQVQNIE